jgi:hypothetical protein
MFHDVLTSKVGLTKKERMKAYVNKFGRVVAAAMVGAALLAAGPGHGSALRLDELPEIGVRVRVRQVDGRTVTPEDTFSLRLAPLPPVAFAGADWSPWAETTREVCAQLLAAYPNQNNRLPQLRLIGTVNPVGRAGGDLQLDVETRLHGGEISRMPAELTGPELGILAWRGTDDLLHVDTLAGHGRRVYDAAMRAAFLPPADRPRRILFGERYIGGDSDAIAQREGIARLCGLGFNAMHSVPKPFVRHVREGGITQLWGAVYSPPGYAFNYATNREAVFRQFVAGQVEQAVASGWQRQEIALWVTSDEPGWYYPGTYDTLNGDPLALADFHAYLRGRGLTPQELGASDWSGVRLVGRQACRDLNSRRLFYWSNRYIPWASSRFFAEVTRAYEAELGPGVPVMVNFNNFLGRLYQPGPVGNNKDKDNPDAAMGQHDWLEFGRLRGSTCIATEDWFDDAAAPQWSFYATRLRSAGELSGVGFGALVIPRVSGQRPEGMAQKLLALVGQGAKTIKFFTFGPEYNFPGNCYAFNTPVYQALSLGMGIVGRAEALLAPGQLLPPEVALLMPQSAQLWDLEEQRVATGLMDVTNTDLFRGHMAYQSETFGLHLALQHAAIPVQAVDEETCAGEALGRYKVVYVTAPDLPEEAVAGLLRWVRAGGTLVLTAGSGLFDRYHQPLGALREAAASAPDRAVRPLLTRLQAVEAGGFVTSGTNTVAFHGERERLTIGDVRVHATFDDGSPAVTERAVGRGRILRYAVFPGLCYRRSATQETGGLPAGFEPAWRDLLLLPVRAAGVVTPVLLDRFLIEAHALASAEGTAVTLLNWSGMPQRELQVAVRTVTRPVRIVSARTGPRPFQVSEEAVGRYKLISRFTVDLADVDVVSLD